jgi:GTPase Era involved in 16S rRNA processing
VGSHKPLPASQVFLELSVKVVEGWRKDGATLKRYGYT